MSRLLMADRTMPGGATDAEPVVIEVSDGQLSILLDDGERLVLGAYEFEAELDQELAADALSRSIEGAA